MVSPSPAISQKQPVLSYADRAKKARNLNAQSSPTPRAPPTTSIPPPVTTVSITPSAVAAPKPLSETESTKALSRGLANNHSPLQPLPSSNGDTLVKESSGDVNPQHVASSSGVASSEPSQKPTAAPATNFWSIRKEQMAQARATTQPQTALGPQNAHSHGAQDVNSSQASSSAPNGLSAASPSHRPNLNGNGANIQTAKNVSPQVLPGVLPPSVDDATSWPTVGMSVSPVPPQLSLSDDVADSTKEEGKKGKEEDKNESIIIPKKSEKPKWVPIPPEELQAAADEHRQHSSQRSAGHSRSRSSQQHTAKPSQGSKPASGSGSNAGSTSGQASQGQSRTHSSSDMRVQQPHSGSASHSQVHSRVGSTHSSPRLQSSSRGGRRLPEDGSTTRPGGDVSRNRSVRSSRVPSPQTVVRSLQPAEALMVSGTPFDMSNVGQQLSGVMDHLRPYPDPEHTLGEPYYLRIPQPLSASNSQPHSYHSTHASNSPSASSYGLPPVAPSHNPYSQPPNMPGYAGTPPYAMYHPNAFNHYQPQPYMPWAGMPQGQPLNIYPVPPQYHHSRSPSNQSGYSPASMPGASTSRDVQQADGMPPPTMMSRPPPPGQSEAVAGYRSEPDAAASRGRQARELSFGTIKRTVANKTPSPPIQEADVPEAKIAEQEEEGGEKSFPVFSIGLNAGENGPPRARSKTHPKVVGTSHERGNTAPARLEGSSQQGETSMDSTGGVTEDPVGTVKVIDLTDSVKPTWEFGTTQHDGAEDARSTDQGAFETPTQPNGAGPVQPPPEPQSTASLIDVAAPLPSISRPPQYIPRMQVPPISVGMPNGVPPFPSHSPSALHPQSSASMVSPSGEYRMTADEWEVKNYGYGFGRVHNGAGLAPPGGRDREYSPRDYSAGKPRRGSYGGYGYDRGSSHERGGFAGRRGRGVSGGFAGRGYGGRNMARGGYQQGQSPRPPFTISQQPMAPPADPGYYAAPPPQGTTYFHPLGYDYAAYPYVPIPPTPVTALTPTSAQAAPPLPMPQSVLSFPLDPTRYYLLGQLEYYLSAQNLAQDFYLKTQMDSRGWISIPLIASFNRVKQLTVDLQLVRDVLMLSSLVEVRGDFVRMRAWQQYVLPAAPPSTVEVTSSESTSDEYTYQSYAHPEFEETGSGTSTSHDEDDDDDEDELSEEEVEFVMGKDQGSWTPERKVPVTATAT